MYLVSALAHWRSVRGSPDADGLGLDPAVYAPQSTAMRGYKQRFPAEPGCKECGISSMERSQETVAAGPIASLQAAPCTHSTASALYQPQLAQQLPIPLRSTHSVSSVVTNRKSILIVDDNVVNLKVRGKDLLFLPTRLGWTSVEKRKTLTRCWLFFF